MNAKSKIALLVFVVVVITDLHYLQGQIVEGEAVHDFDIASQEIRFNEKNLFLYHDQAYLEQLQVRLDTARQILKDGRHVFSEIATHGEIVQVEGLLQEYTEQLHDYMNISVDKRTGIPALRFSRQECRSESLHARENREARSLLRGRGR